MSTPTREIETEPTGPVDHLRFHRPHAHLAPTFGTDRFALRAEAFARFFGTPTFLGAQTLTERIESLTSEMHQHFVGKEPPKA
ncbi:MULTISPECIES: hypothetical protein [Pseudomonas]|uniref:Uncharacterized protein n=1 Tax=Pseudomonas fluorescens TaxID=294 RepID=A0A166PAH7_PSEFL|nr:MULTISPECIES: hypothetical protein [Pseudomonas]KZN18668.1 hypothetical protein A1D17_21765 [Pseudomonas fluorescens]